METGVFTQPDAPAPQPMQPECTWGKKTETTQKKQNKWYNNQNNQQSITSRIISMHIERCLRNINQVIIMETK